MSDRTDRRRRARPVGPEPREVAGAAGSPVVSPLAAFLDDAQAALSELRDSEPTLPVRGRKRSD